VLLGFKIASATPTKNIGYIVTWQNDFNS